MTMPELTALDNAYQALQPLGQDARRRALQWLSDALVHGHIRPEMTTTSGTTTPSADIVTVEPVAVEVESPRRRSKSAAATKRVPASASATAPKARRGRRLKGGASQAAVKGERPYRRMPDPDTIMKAYRKVGTVSGLADRFQVPRHTVNHWARRLRSQGYDIGRAG
jgi:hypothetical protein